MDYFFFVLILPLFEQIPEGDVRGWNPAFPGDARTENGSSETLDDARKSPRPKCAASPGPGSPDGGNGAGTHSGPCPSPLALPWVHEATRTERLLGAGEVYIQV